MKKYDKFIASFPPSKILTNEPLSRHTYFKIGGPADLFCTADSSDELRRIIEMAIANDIPFKVLGGGSNILVTDKGCRGLIIKNRSSKITLKGFSGSGSKNGLNVDYALIQADSGVPANALIRRTIDDGLKGLEDFLGLPGTVGGAIYNNSHHLGKLIGDHVQEVTVINKKGNLKSYNAAELEFSYDYSLLQKTHEIILTTTFKLAKGDKRKLWISAESAVKRRSTTQPLGIPSSGCIFKNIELSDAVRLATPNHTCSVGYLIDKLGLKGYSKGSAEISDKHANFIVNKGGATFDDVMYLVNLIQDKLKQEYGVKVKMEVFVLGEK